MRTNLASIGAVMAVFFGFLILAIPPAFAQSDSTVPVAVMEMPTAAHFMTPVGERIVVEPGNYWVELVGQALRLSAFDGRPSVMVAVDELSHDEIVDEPTASAYAGETDEDRDILEIALFLPGDKYYSAMGSISGVSTRGWKERAKNRVATAKKNKANRQKNREIRQKNRKEKGLVGSTQDNLSNRLKTFKENKDNRKEMRWENWEDVKCEAGKFIFSPLEWDGVTVEENCKIGTRGIADPVAPVTSRVAVTVAGVSSAVKIAGAILSTATGALTVAEQGKGPFSRSITLEVYNLTDKPFLYRDYYYSDGTRFTDYGEPVLGINSSFDSAIPGAALDTFGPKAGTWAVERKPLIPTGVGGIVLFTFDPLEEGINDNAKDLVVLFTNPIIKWGNNTNETRRARWTMAGAWFINQLRFFNNDDLKDQLPGLYKVALQKAIEDKGATLRVPNDEDLINQYDPKRETGKNYQECVTGTCYKILSQTGEGSHALARIIVYDESYNYVAACENYKMRHPDEDLNCE